MIHSIALAHVLCGLADDDTQFDLPVRLESVARDLNGIVRTYDRAGSLHKHDGLRRYRGACLGGMVGVVQPDADEFSRTAHARAQAWIASHARQRSDVERFQAGQTVGQQNVAGDVGHMARQVPHVSIGVEQARLLPAGRTVA